MNRSKEHKRLHQLSDETYLEWPLSPQVSSTSRRKKPESDLLKFVHCDSEKFVWLNARESRHPFSLRKGNFLCDWFQYQKVNTIIVHTFKQQTRHRCFPLKREVFGRLQAEIHLLHNKNAKLLLNECQGEISMVSVQQMLRVGRQNWAEVRQVEAMRKLEWVQGTDCFVQLPKLLCPYHLCRLLAPPPAPALFTLPNHPK